MSKKRKIRSKKKQRKSSRSKRRSGIRLQSECSRGAQSPSRAEAGIDVFAAERELSPFQGQILIEYWCDFPRKRDFWTIGAVDAMSTEKIVERLAELDISVTPDILRAASGAPRSAWRLSRELWARELERLEVAEKDFAGIAMCILWARWLPDAPAFESIALPWYYAEQMAYDHDLSDPLECLEKRIEAWEALDSVMPPREGGDVDVEPWIDCGLFSRWQEGVCLELPCLLAQRERKDLAERTLAALARMEERFPGKGASTLLWTGAERARLLLWLERDKEAFALAEDLLTRYPKWAGAYHLLAELHLWGGDASSRRSLMGAREVLTRGLAMDSLDDLDRELMRGHLQNVGLWLERSSSRD